MAEQGFEYVPRPFVSQRQESPVENGLFLSLAEKRGYGGMHLAAIQMTLPAGPGESVSQDQLDAFDRALIGPGEHPHVTDGSEHSHGDDEPHSHGPREFGGCQGVGQSVLDNLAITEALVDDPLWGRLFDEVFSSDSFVLFEEAWAFCMAQNGVDVNERVANNTLTQPTVLQRYSFGSQIGFSVEAQMYMQSLSVNGWALPASNGDLNSDWFDAVAASESGLATRLELEIAAAITDSECRLQSRHLLDDEIDRIEAELGLSS